MRYIIPLFLAMAVTIVQAQTMYTDDLTELAGTLRSLMADKEKILPTDGTGRLAIHMELFELQRKLYRIAEEAGQANLELMRLGYSRPALTACCCHRGIARIGEELTLSYLDTRDKVFWTASKFCRVCGSQPPSGNKVTANHSVNRSCNGVPRVVT